MTQEISKSVNFNEISVDDIVSKVFGKESSYMFTLLKTRRSLQCCISAHNKDLVVQSVIFKFLVKWKFSIERGKL